MKKINYIICICIISVLLGGSTVLGSYVSIPTWSNDTIVTSVNDEEKGNF